MVDGVFEIGIGFVNAHLVVTDDGVVLVARALVALAVAIENTRLIDNLVLGEDASPMEGAR